MMQNKNNRTFVRGIEAGIAVLATSGLSGAACAVEISDRKMMAQCRSQPPKKTGVS
jgi:hypothetical protein